MIPVVGSDGWFLMPLRPTKFTPAKLAKVHVVDGEIVSAFTREPYPNAPEAAPRRQLHWTARFGSWVQTS